VCGTVGECCARWVGPAARQDVEDEGTVAARCDLAAAKDNDLASYESRGVHMARQWQVSLHLRMGLLRRLCEVGMTGKKSKS